MSGSIRRAGAVVLAITLAFSAPAAGADGRRVDHVAKSVFDLAVLRPLDLTALGVGLAVFPVAYAIALPVGGGEDIVRACVRHPARRLFERPLGAL